MQISVYLDTSEPPDKNNVSIDEEINNEKNTDEEDLNNTSSRRGNIKKTNRIIKNVDNRIVKCKLITILKNHIWLPKIKNIVKIVNMIKTESYFFFNQYILYLLSNNKNINFTKTTIERATLFILGMQNTIRYKDNEYKLLDNVYIDFSNQIYKDDNLLFTAKQIIQNSIDNTKKGELEYVFFDYETIIDFELLSCMKEYSLSILNLTVGELKELEEADNKNDIEKVQFKNTKSNNLPPPPLILQPQPQTQPQPPQQSQQTKPKQTVKKFTQTKLVFG